MTMQEVSTFRLYVLRATYLLVSVGLALLIGPLLMRPQTGVEHYRGVVRCLLAGVGILAALGVRYPLRMLPVLMFELVWKTVWVALVGLPLWMNGQLTGEFAETMANNVLGLVIVPLALPWGYVLKHYLRAPGDPWTAPAPPARNIPAT
jgi:hypothetical protein